MRGGKGLLTALALAAGAGCDRLVDYTGGTKLTYEVVARPRVDPQSDPRIVQATVDLIKSRLDLYGARYRVSVEGNDRFSIQFPRARSSQELADLRLQVESVGRLDFHLVAPQSEQTAARVAEAQDAQGGYEAAEAAWWGSKRDSPEPPEPSIIARPEAVSSEEDGQTKLVAKPRNMWGNHLTILQNDGGSKVSGMHLTRASSTYDENGKPAVSFQFSKEGAGLMAAMTGSNKRRVLAIVLDDQIVEMATIRSRIYDQGQLSGNFTQKDIRRIVIILNGGSLPAKLKLLAETSIGKN
jgi:preprotein translocase subunit SecD